MATTLNVTSYKDNPDGTTTNYLSDGSSDTGTYSKNADNSLTFNPTQNMALTNPVVPTSIGVSSFGTPTTPTPQIPLSQKDTGASLVAMTNKGVQQGEQALAQAETENKQVGTSIADLMAQLSGESTDVIQAQQDQGIPQLGNEIRNLQQSVRSKQQKYLQGLTDIESGNIRSLSENQKVALQRQNALDVAITESQLQAKQGNLIYAQELVKNAVNLKYQPIKDALEAKKFVLENISNVALSRADKKLAEEKKKQYDLQLSELETTKKNEETVNKLIIDASPVAPPDVLQRAKDIQAKGGSATEVAMALGKYGGDYLGDLVKRSTLAKNEADVRKTNAEYEKTMKEIKILGQAPAVTAPAGTNANFIQNMAASAVNKESLSQTERTAVTKNLTVLDQLDSLQSNIAKQNNDGFIKGKVNNIMAAIGQNADVGTINSQLQAIVPNLARGVYGEVGVLTDNDIANYRKTLPNLTMPKDQNDAVLALTLKAVQKNLKNTLETAANSKMDVSRFAPQYQEVTNKINEINDRIGVSKQEVIDYGKKNPQTQKMISDLSAQGYKPSQILQILGVEN